MQYNIGGVLNIIIKSVNRVYSCKPLFVGDLHVAANVGGRGVARWGGLGGGWCSKTSSITAEQEYKLWSGLALSYFIFEQKGFELLTYEKTFGERWKHNSLPQAN